VVFFGGILSFSLAFAGGAMIYVIADEMMPRAREQGRLGVYSFVVGICTMLFLNTAI
jgi:ZIP family zinc transporter